MKIIQFNHKTAANLLKKSVEEHWLEDKDAYIRFTDGSVVCIHMLNPKWETFVALNERTEKESTTNGVSVTDEQKIHLWYPSTGEECLFTSRTAIIGFDFVNYYATDRLNYPTRQYVPIVEFHYYEKGEDIARNDS